MIITLHGKINHASLQSYNHILSSPQTFSLIVWKVVFFLFFFCELLYEFSLYSIVISLSLFEQLQRNYQTEEKIQYKYTTKGPIPLSETVLKRYFEETFAASSKWNIHLWPYHLITFTIRYVAGYYNSLTSFKKGLDQLIEVLGFTGY